MSQLEHSPSAAFGPSLLTLLKGAAGDEATRDAAQQQRNHQLVYGNEKTSSFTSDMLSTLPSNDRAADVNDDFAARSNYVAQHRMEREHREEAAAAHSQIQSNGQDSNDDDSTPIFGATYKQNIELGDTDKLNIYLEEFGDSGMDQALGECEKFVADVTAFYVDDVIVKGYALLTTHRFFFLAYLPKSVSTPNGVENGSKDSTKVLSAPGYFTRPSRRVSKRKVWFELHKEVMVGYKNSQRLYEPLGSVRILHIKNLIPFIEGGKEVHFSIRGDQCWMEFDTTEAASAWHRELTGLIWQSKHNVDTLRVAIPLPRIHQLTTTTFMDFSKVTTFKVDQSSHRHDPLSRMQSLNIGIHVPVSDAFLTPLRQRWQDAREKTNGSFHYVPVAILDLQDPHEGENGKDHSSERHIHLHHHRNHEKDDNTAQRLQFFNDVNLLSRGIEKICTVSDMGDLPPNKVFHPLRLTLDTVFRADVVRGIPHGGHLVLTPEFLCFYSRRVFRAKSGVRTKIPLSDIQDVQSDHAIRWHCYGIRLLLNAHADMCFELHSKDEREKLLQLLKSAVASTKEPSQDEQLVEKAKPKYASRLSEMLQQDIAIPQHVVHKLRTVINVDVEKHLKLPPMRIACLTIGSRGDVQPYIALCKSLMEHGHQCVIVSHPEYKEWVNKNGIEFRPAGGDPGILMKLSVENKMFSPTFFTETLGKFRQWLDELLREIIEQCYDVELIIESPSTFGGIHAAEALEIGYMRAFTMPWTKTSAYPQAFSVPSVDLGAGYNSLSYELYEQVIWLASEGQINRWRRHMLGLSSTSLAKLELEHVPFMYNFSPGVVPPPLDWGNMTTITGYWNLPSTSSDWQPPADLEVFLVKARKEDKKIAYIGFGSITIPNAHKTMQIIFDAAQQSGVYCVVSKGWSDRMEESLGKETQIPWNIPDCVYLVDSIPHDWLFPRIDIAMHHGGAGTTGASLANKLVTLIHPFFGDQFFWAIRVEKLGAGQRVASLNIHDIKHALTHAAQDRLMREKAARVGEAIKLDHGVESARAFIYRHYKASKRKAHRTSHTHQSERKSSTLLSDKDQQHPPAAVRQDSELTLSMVESPLNDESGGATAKHSCSSYSSKRAKQEDIDRRVALLEKCRIEGKHHILKNLESASTGAEHKVQTAH